MPVCIYCRQQKPIREFNKEHVLPRAFGSFIGAPTLARPREFRVCGACNQTLGDSLDIGLARGSWEAIVRIERGLVDPSARANVRYDRLTLRLPAEHAMAPMLLQVVPAVVGGSGINTAPIAQIRIAIDNGPLVCIRESRIADELPQLLSSGKPTRVEIFWWGGDAAGPSRVREKASAAGLGDWTWHPIGDGTEPRPERIDAEFEFKIDSIVSRAIAKIGYEFFYWVLERRAPHLLVTANTDAIRRFVFEGTGEPTRFVHPSNRPILEHDTATLRQTGGHILVLQWKSAPQAPVVVRVGLFNDLVYDVEICGGPSPIWHDINVGLHFDLRACKVTSLTSSRLLLPPPRRIVIP